MTVKLLDSLGDDLTIVNSARVSFAKVGEPHFLWDQLKADDPELYFFLQRELQEEERNGRLRAHSWAYWLRKFGYMRLRDGDAKLLAFLARNRHATPFEHVVFQFWIKCAIDEAREWQRHRIASYNEVSTRYVEVENDFIVPDADHITVQFGKPGDYHYKPVEDSDTADWVAGKLRAVNEFGYATYQELVQAGIAKQVARKALTLAKTTEFYVTANLRSWFNFMYLRNATTALDFIADDAREIERLIKGKVPAAIEAWEAGGRLPI